MPGTITLYRGAAEFDKKRYGSKMERTRIIDRWTALKTSNYSWSYIITPDEPPPAAAYPNIKKQDYLTSKKEKV